MPFPYELYPKAKETHCLNLPEISVSRPPFPGSIRTADGCLWGWRDNNSYVSTHKTDKVCTADGKCYNYNDVFVDEVDPGYSNTCGQTCYVACSCNTSNGWYSSCQGSDCFSVTDTRYAGQPNAASASRSISDVASISASGANSGISASAAANSGLKTASATGNYTATAASAAAAATGAKSGISTLASGATTCYKKKTCSEGGYFDSVPADQKCSSKSYNGYSCYTGCSYKTCSDYGYYDSMVSGMTCSAVTPRSGLTCYTCHTYFPPEFKVKVDAGPGTMFWGALTQDFKHDDHNMYPTLSESEVCYDMSMYTQEGGYFYAKGTYTELKNGVKFSDIKAGEYWNPSFTFRLCSSDFGVAVTFSGMEWGMQHPHQIPGYNNSWQMINMTLIGNVCKRIKYSDGNVYNEDCSYNEISGYTIPVEEAALTIFEVKVW